MQDPFCRVFIAKSESTNIQYQYIVDWKLRTFAELTVMANIAALLELYATMAGVPLNPATEAVFTIE